MIPRLVLSRGASSKVRGETFLTSILSYREFYATLFARIYVINYSGVDKVLLMLHAYPLNSP